MRVLIDTNVLVVRMSEPTHALHQTAIDAIQWLSNQSYELLIVPQSLYEFWSVATRSVAANGLGKSTSYAESRVASLCGMFTLLRDERAIYETWLKLVADLAIPGVKSFDARLAAAMMRHGITHLLTFNSAHFQRFTHLAILDPIQVAVQAGKT